MRRDVDLVADLVNAARFIGELIAGMTVESFLADRRTHFAVFSQFIIMGEAARRLSARLRNANAHVPWREIISMRNRVVHGYDEIDWELVWDTAVADVPQLLEQLERIAHYDEGR